MEELVRYFNNYISLNNHEKEELLSRFTKRNIKRRLYILIEKYTTFSLKSIPLLVFNELLIKTTSNAKTYDKNGYEARNLEKVLSRM